MKQKDHLHTLIHTLTPTEKRYFKRFALSQGIGEHARYLELFEALQAQHSYQAPALAQQLGLQGEEMTLAARKTYLYQLILKSLRSYNLRKKNSLKLKGLLSDVWTLYQKALFRQCEKVLARALKLAEAQADLPALIEIHIWKRKLSKIAEHKSRGKTISALIQEKNILMERLNRYFIAYDQHDLVFLELEEEVPQSSRDQWPQFAIGFHTARLQLQRESMEAAKNENLDLALEKAHAALALWEASKEMIEEHPVLYRIQIFNLLHLLALADRYQEFPSWFQLLDAGIPQSEVEVLYFYQNRYLFELIYLLNSNIIQDSSSRLMDISDWLEAVEDKVPLGRLLVLYVNLGIAFLLTRAYGMARRWNDKLIAARKSGVRTELQYWGRALDLVLCQEQGLDNLLGYRLRSADRYFKSKGQVSDFGQLVLRTFKGILKHPSGPAHKAHVLNMHTHLVQLMELRSKAPGMLEFSLWLRSLLLERPMIQLIGQV